MPYLGKSPSQAVRRRYQYVVSAGATSVSGSDANGNTLLFSDGEYVDVYLNGVKLKADTDYNTSTANTIASLSALAASDEITVVVYDTFGVFSGTFSNDVTVGGNLKLGTGSSVSDIKDEDNMVSNSATALSTQQSIKAYVDATVAATNEVVEDTSPQLGGTLDTNGNLIQFGDSGSATDDRLQFGASQDLQLYHDGSNSYITDTGTGGLYLQANADFLVQSQGSNENMIYGASNAFVKLYHNGTERLSTTASGIDVSGGVQIDDGGSLGFGGTNYKIEGSSSANHRIAFHTDGSEAMRIDSSQRIGIGETSPGSLLHVKASDTGIAPHSSAQITLEREGTNFLQFLTAETGTSGILFGDGSDIDVGKIVYDHNVPAMQFFVETSEAMRIDSSGRAMIGTTTADGILKLDNTGQTSETLLTLEDTGGSGAHSQITLKNTTGVVASLLTTSDNLEFRVDDATVFSNISGTERMRIDSAGNVGIGTSSPSSLLHLYASSGDASLTIEANQDSGSAEPSINLKAYATNANPKINFGDRLAYPGFIEYENSDDSMRLGTNGSERLRIHSNGVASFNDGIALGVGTANTSSNVLDDYEEGTWTPVLKSATNTVSYSGTFLANYVKIGRMVHYSLSYRGGTFSGDVTGATTSIEGLPFASSSTAGNRQPSTQVNYYVGIKFDDENVLGLVGENTSIIEVVGHDGATSGYNSVGIHSVGSNAYLQVSGIYYV